MAMILPPSSSSTWSTSLPSWVRQWPVPADPVEPGCLLEDLEHDEGLQQMPELLQARGVRSGELGRAEAQQPARESGVDHVQLGGRHGTGPQGLPPGR
jgi:hypothetical protein